jgi:hypothetical protein
MQGLQQTVAQRRQQQQQQQQVPATPYPSSKTKAAVKPPCLAW